jgi:hypothetical protein
VAAEKERGGMRVHPDKFADPMELHRHAELNGLVYAWEFTRAFAKWQELLTREQYELVEVRTSQGTSRAMLFSRAMEVEQQVAAERERWLAIQAKRADSAHAPHRR